jgi:tRNA (cytidine/uridine-2'-O-)-methyltransferase
LPTTPFNIVLVEPEIPPNTGSIARLCGATKTVLHLVRPLGFSTEDRYLKRAGLDYWKFVEIVYWDNFETFLTAHPLERLHFLSKKAQKSYLECHFTPGDFLIFGKETKGLPSFVMDSFPDQCYRIPIDNTNIRSLNLAMTCGIVLYEAHRQSLSE